MSRAGADVGAALFVHGAGVGPDPICSEQESAPGPWTSGAAYKSGGSATLVASRFFNFYESERFCWC